MSSILNPKLLNAPIILYGYPWDSQLACKRNPRIYPRTSQMFIKDRPRFYIVHGCWLRIVTAHNPSIFLAWQDESIVIWERNPSGPGFNVGGPCDVRRAGKGFRTEWAFSPLWQSTTSQEHIFGLLSDVYSDQDSPRRMLYLSFQGIASLDSWSLVESRRSTNQPVIFTTCQCLALGSAALASKTVWSCNPRYHKLWGMGVTIVMFFVSNNTLRLPDSFFVYCG